jgi:pimeloyl-ACP methyl ester carboxylesterase
MPTSPRIQSQLAHADEGPASGQHPARCILVLHGSASSRRQWASFLATRQDDERIIAPDLRGYGESRTTHAEGGGEEDVRALAELLDTLDARQPIDLAGFSYGGAVAFELAGKMSSRLRSLTLIEPTIFDLLRVSGDEAWHEIEQLSQGHIRFVDENAPEQAADIFMNYWIGAEAWNATAEHRRQPIIAMMPKVAMEWRWMRQQSDDPARFVAPQIPTHLIVGTRTTKAANRVVELLATRWPAAWVSRIEGASHLSLLTHPEEVNRAIRSFLQQLGPEQWASSD